MVSSTSIWQRTFTSPRHPILLVFSVVLAPALWLLFVGSLNLHELLVGVVASLATIAFLLFVCRSSTQKLTLRPQDVVQFWRIPWYIAVDVCAVTLVLAKDLLRIAPVSSLYRVCGFDTSAHDPLRKARTVMAVAYSTASPNIIIIGIDPSSSRMLFHQIKAAPISEMTRALGAKS